MGQGLGRGDWLVSSGGERWKQCEVCELASCLGWSCAAQSGLLTSWDFKQPPVVFASNANGEAVLFYEGLGT